MPALPWFRLSADVLRREQDRRLAEWFAREVPHSSWWRSRISDPPTTVAEMRDRVTVSVEAEIAAAGGQGNPALLLSPTEAQFKSRAGLGDLLSAARRLGAPGGGRREAIWHRYKPVHVHEAGVDRLLAIAYTRSDLDLLHLASARTAEVLGWGADDALVNLLAPRPSVRWWGLYHAALASRMTALHPRAGGETVDAAARRSLRLLPASVLAVDVADADSVVEALDGLPLPNLRQLVTVGEPPDAATRIRLVEGASRAAGRPVTVQAAWAPECGRVLHAESPPAVNDPPEATFGLLTQPDLEVLEVRDAATGQVVTDGGPGELVVTSVGWRGTALVRVATGTWVAGLEDAAPHPVTGATVPRLAPQVADGAWQPRVRTSAGWRRPDLRPVGGVVASTLARHDITTWSLGPVRDGLALALPRRAPGGPADEAPLQTTVDALAQRIGELAGVVPQVVRDDALAARTPQVGRAG